MRDVKEVYLGVSVPLTHTSSIQSSVGFSAEKVMLLNLRTFIWVGDTCHLFQFSCVGTYNGESCKKVFKNFKTSTVV